jgi:hypothetical protein
MTSSTYKIDTNSTNIRLGVGIIGETKKQA